MIPSSSCPLWLPDDQPANLAGERDDDVALTPHSLIALKPPSNGRRQPSTLAVVDRSAVVPEH